MASLGTFSASSRTSALASKLIALCSGGFGDKKIRFCLYCFVRLLYCFGRMLCGFVGFVQGFSGLPDFVEVLDNFLKCRFQK